MPFLKAKRHRAYPVVSGVRVKDRRLTTWSKRGLEFGGFSPIDRSSGYAGGDLQILDFLFGTIIIKSFGVKRRTLVCYYSFGIAESLLL
ncbi:hypothetical protein TNCV_748501 [Trichonephila clavipes]|nr:hypothetical protein TNCV_748501 [Trichonephila clavipes]